MIIRIDTVRLYENIELLCGQHASGMKQSILNAVEKSFYEDVLICSMANECTSRENCRHGKKHTHTTTCGMHGVCDRFVIMPDCKITNENNDER